jgi:hypothetical protein
MSHAEPIDIDPRHRPLAAALHRANQSCPNITQSPCHRIPGPLAGRKDPKEVTDLPG